MRQAYSYVGERICWTGHQNTEIKRTPLGYVLQVTHNKPTSHAREGLFDTRRQIHKHHLEHYWDVVFFRTTHSFCASLIVGCVHFGNHFTQQLSLLNGVLRNRRCLLWGRWHTDDGSLKKYTSVACFSLYYVYLKKVPHSYIGGHSSWNQVRLQHTINSQRVFACTSEGNHIDSFPVPQLLHHSSEPITNTILDGRRWMVQCNSRIPCI